MSIQSCHVCGVYVSCPVCVLCCVCDMRLLGMRLCRDVYAATPWWRAKPLRVRISSIMYLLCCGVGCAVYEGGKAGEYRHMGTLKLWSQHQCIACCLSPWLHCFALSAISASGKSRTIASITRCNSASGRSWVHTSIILSKCSFRLMALGVGGGGIKIAIAEVKCYRDSGFCSIALRLSKVYPKLQLPSMQFLNRPYAPRHAPQCPCCPIQRKRLYHAPCP